MAGALIRRITLRTRFAVRTPYGYSAGPLAAAALGVAIGWAVPYWPLQLALGLAGYAALLGLWRVLTGETLSLDRFETG